MMKKFVMMSLLLMLTITMAAQEKFSPEKFEADLKAYISKEAGLTSQETKCILCSVRCVRNSVLSMIRFARWA